MFLTPKDIHDKTFKRSFKGYDENEVDEFLDLVIKEFNLMIDENERLRQELTAKPIVQEYSATSVNEIKHLEALLAQAIENMNKNAEIVMTRGFSGDYRPKEEPDKAQEKNKLDEFKKTLETYKSSFNTLIEDQRRQINQKYNEILANYGEAETTAAPKSAPLFYAPEPPAQPQIAEQPVGGADSGADPDPASLILQSGFRLDPGRLPLPIPYPAMRSPPPRHTSHSKACRRRRPNPRCNLCSSLRSCVSSFLPSRSRPACFSSLYSSSRPSLRLCQSPQ